VLVVMSFAHVDTWFRLVALQRSGMPIPVVARLSTHAWESREQRRRADRPLRHEGIVTLAEQTIKRSVGTVTSASRKEGVPTPAAAPD
jgi:hypothetical protein